MFWLYLTCAILSALLLFAIWIGVFRSTKVVEAQFRGGVFFYKDVQDLLQNIGRRFVQVEVDRTKILGNKTGASKFGIYYDDPFNIKEPQLFRACIGLLVDPKLTTSDTEKSFLDLGYKKKVLPPSKCLHGDFPEKISLSHVVGAIKFYTEYFKFVGRNTDKYSYTHEYGGSLELLEDGFIKYYFPQENHKDFHFSCYPKSEMKNPNKNIELAGRGKKIS